MLVAVSSISGSPGVSSWSLLFSAAWPGDDRRNRVLVETDSTGGVLAVRYGLSPTPGIVELISNVRQGVGLRETLGASAHRLDEQLWAVPAPSSADAAWPILVRMGDLGPVLSGGDDIWFVDCGRWWPSSPCVGITSSADLNLILVDADDSSLLSVRSRVHHFRQFGKVGVVVVGSTQRSLEELEMNFGADKVWNIPHIKQLDILAGQAATTGQSKRSKSRRSKAWRQALKMSGELRHLLDSAAVTRPATDMSQGAATSDSQVPQTWPQPSVDSVPNEPSQQVQPVVDFSAPPAIPMPSAESGVVDQSLPPAPGVVSPTVSVPSGVVEQSVAPPAPEVAVPPLPDMPAAISPANSPQTEQTEITSTPISSVPSSFTKPAAEARPSVSSEQYDPSFTAPNVPPTSTGRSTTKPVNESVVAADFGQPAPSFPDQASPPMSPVEKVVPADPAMPPAETAVPGQPAMPPAETAVPGQPAMPPAETAIPGQPAMPPLDAMTTLSTAQLSDREFEIGQPSTPKKPPATHEQFPAELKPHTNKSLQEIAATTANVPGVTRVINASALDETTHSGDIPAEAAHKKPSMPPIHHAAYAQIPVKEDIAPTETGGVSSAADVSEQNSNYFYDAPTLLPTKKSTVSTPEEAAPTNGSNGNGTGGNRT